MEATTIADDYMPTEMVQDGGDYLLIETAKMRSSFARSPSATSRTRTTIALTSRTLRRKMQQI